MRNLTRLLITSCLAGAAAPAIAQTANDNGVPVITPQAGEVYYRVPLQGRSTSNASTYAWVEDVSSCSTQCGAGTRTTSYQCQDISNVDFVGGTGYGAPEQSSQCVSTVGAAPASTSESCTVYSGCGYNWVTPAVVQTVSPIAPYPAGRVGCGQVREQYSPYCQRSDGLVLSSADNNYCKDASGYPAGQPAGSDSFGYDRTTIQTASCTTADHGWTAGSWSPWSSTCSDAATRTRSVTCNRNFDGTVQADSNCTASLRPAASETTGQYGDCSYRWDASAWSPWDSQCSNSAVRTRSVSCLRSDGTTVSDSFCVSAGAKPAASEVSSQYGSCPHSWQTGAWNEGSSLCTATESQTRSVWCRRDLDGATVADANCTATKPTTSQVVADWSGCTFNWTTGAWGASSSTCSPSAVQTRSVTCVRSDGTISADSSCLASSKPSASQVVADYSACTFAAGGTITNGTWSSTCSATATRTNTSQCIRSDGSVVASSECTTRGISLTSTETAPNYSGCPYSWTAGSWGPWSSTCSASAVRTRAVTCVRGDGTVSADSNCTASTKPAASEVSSQYGSCPHSWQTGAWNEGSSLCTATESQTRSVWCRRDLDGATVADANCTATKPTTSQTVPDYSGCTFNWNVSAWSGWSSTCSTSAVRTRSVTCVRSDGTVASDASCPSPKPDASEVGSNLSDCSYTANYGSWSSCTMGVQTRNNTCSRSDGQVFFDSVSVQTYCGIPATQNQACQSAPTFNGYWNAGEGGCSSPTFPNPNLYGGGSKVVTTSGTLTGLNSCSSSSVGTKGYTKQIPSSMTWYSPSLLGGGAQYLSQSAPTCNVGEKGYWVNPNWPNDTYNVHQIVVVTCVSSSPPSSWFGW